jgi:hypothetical protein
MLRMLRIVAQQCFFNETSVAPQIWSAQCHDYLKQLYLGRALLFGWRNRVVAGIEPAISWIRIRGSDQCPMSTDYWRYVESKLALYSILPAPPPRVRSRSTCAQNVRSRSKPKKNL